MSVLPINVYGDKILKQKAKKVQNVDQKTLQLIQDMFETMRESDGVGLAANQVGVRDSIIVADLSQVEGYEDTKPTVIINPEIILGEGNSSYEEGCLSLPGIRLNIERPERIKLRFQDTDLIIHEKYFEGLFGRVLQHEIDHLNGVLLTDRISDEEKKNLNESLNNIVNRTVEVNYEIS
ncbi:MAG: peptide deformylase [Ignavibacteria bacterium]|nr:peptide deformylase [Ignavibacteria bacterium]